MKKILYALLLALISFGSLFYFIGVQRGEYSLFYRYALIGCLIFLYAWMIQLKNLKGAFKIFTVGVVLSVLALSTTLSKINEPFVDLGAILMWMMATALGVLLGLVYEILRFFYLRYKI